jgi:hypothetical protein
MIVWLNGTHGAGKTTTSALVQQLIPDSRVFDAEKVGETLMDITPGLPQTDNFQHWPPWRQLVVDTARRVLDYTGGTLVMPMTVLVEQYWREISTGLAQHAIPVGTSSCTLTNTPSAGVSNGNTPSPPRFASNTLSPTPRRPARGYMARPRSSTRRTSRPPKPPCRSQRLSRVEARQANRARGNEERPSALDLCGLVASARSPGCGSPRRSIASCNFPAHRCTPSPSPIRAW